MCEDRDPPEILRLLADEYARCILVQASEEVLSAEVLSERCDASLSTVYRRAESLVSAGLVAERTEPDEDGHHYTRYEATVGRIGVIIEDGTVELDVTEDTADRFTRVWEDIRGADG